MENFTDTLIYADSWDVINGKRESTFIVWTYWLCLPEAFNDDGTFRQSVFFNTTGTDYIKTAFRAARAADPHAKLYVRQNP